MIFHRNARMSSASHAPQRVSHTRNGEAGFSILEAFLAVIILGVVGFALHSATLAGIRYVQVGKARAEQARHLEYAIDWARAGACFLRDQLADEPFRFELDTPPFSEELPAEFREGTLPQTAEPDPVLATLPILIVEVRLPPGEHVSSLTHTLMLDVSGCGS